MPGKHLYILQSHSTGAIKVGRSDDPGRRLGEVQTGNPNRLRIILVAEGLGHREREVHRSLRRHRTRHADGEWFHEIGMGEMPVDVYERLMDWYMEDPDWWRRP